MGKIFEPDAAHRQLVANIQQLMKARELSRSRLSRLADLSPSLISNIMALKSTPSLRSLTQLAGALEVTTSELVKGC